MQSDANLLRRNRLCDSIAVVVDEYGHDWISASQDGQTERPASRAADQPSVAMGNTQGVAAAHLVERPPP
jgi:hypothetical protein